MTKNKVTVTFCVTVTLFFLLTKLAVGDEDRELYFYKALSICFENYYRSVCENKISHPEEKLIHKVSALLAKNTLKPQVVCDIKSIEELEAGINQILKIYNYQAVLFAIPNSKIINCWMGELVEEKTMEETIFGMEIKFNTLVLDNLQIHDYLYFLTEGKEMLDAGTKDNNVYFNLEAFRRQAEGIRDFFNVRHKENHSKRYDASRFNRLRKRLQHKAWQEIYEQNSSDMNFVTQVTERMKLNGLAHELAHLYIKNNPGLSLDDIKEEEKFSFLYELSYGKMPFETLNTIVGVYAKGLKDIYGDASRNILDGFISYIRKKHTLGDIKYKRILIRGALLKDNLDCLYSLSEKQVREIAVELLNSLHM